MQMKAYMRLSTLTLAIVAGSFATACAKNGDAKETKTAASGDKGIPDVLATVGNEKITMSDVRARAGEELDRIETQYQQSKSDMVGAALNTILKEKVLGEEARKSGKTYEQLVQAEAGINGTEPSQEEIAAWFVKNQSRTGGRSLPELTAQIADLLRKEKTTKAEASLQARLAKDYKVAVAFQPYRFEFNNTNAPTMGSDKAPVTLVEFSDFQCPFCNRFAPNLKFINQRYGDKVHIVYRQYPIPALHPFALKAAEASLCAKEQGKFWELHDEMFKDQTKLAVKDLKASAAALGMNSGKFNQCLDSGRYAEQVQNDMAEGTRIGVNGTPAVFINGVELKGGAVPFDAVVAAIDQELARVQAYGK